MVRSWLSSLVIHEILREKGVKLDARRFRGLIRAVKMARQETKKMLRKVYCGIPCFSS